MARPVGRGKRKRINDPASPQPLIHSWGIFWLHKGRAGAASLNAAEVLLHVDAEAFGKLEGGVLVVAQQVKNLT